jgi:hypothetical protein
LTGSGGKQAGLKIATVAENHRSVQGQSWFRTVPIDELVDGVTVSALAIDTGQAVSTLPLLKIQDPANGFWGAYAVSKNAASASSTSGLLAIRPIMLHFEPYFRVVGHSTGTVHFEIWVSTSS